MTSVTKDSWDNPPQTKKFTVTRLIILCCSETPHSGDNL